MMMTAGFKISDKLYVKHEVPDKAICSPCNLRAHKTSRTRLWTGLHHMYVLQSAAKQIGPRHLKALANDVAVARGATLVTSLVIEFKQALAFTGFMGVAL